MSQELLPIPEVLSSNQAIGKILKCMYLQLTVEKTKTKMPGMTLETATTLTTAETLTTSATTTTAATVAAMTTRWHPQSLGSLNQGSKLKSILEISIC